MIKSKIHNFLVVTGFHYWEPATPIVSKCNGIFTDQSIFRYFSRKKGFSLHEHASVRIKQCGLT